MENRHNIYKGLQRPFIYKGFKGKFILWGAGVLVFGLAVAGIISNLVDPYLGCGLGVAVIVGGLFYISQKQKRGLHSKTINRGIFVPQIRLVKNLKYGKKDF